MNFELEVNAILLARELGDIDLDSVKNELIKLVENCMKEELKEFYKWYREEIGRDGFTDAAVINIVNIYYKEKLAMENKPIGA